MKLFGLLVAAVAAVEVVGQPEFEATLNGDVVAVLDNAADAREARGVPQLRGSLPSGSQTSHRSKKAKTKKAKKAKKAKRARTEQRAGPSHAQTKATTETAQMESFTVAKVAKEAAEAAAKLEKTEFSDVAVGDHGFEWEGSQDKS